MIKCEICNKSFKNKYALNGHIKIHNEGYLEKARKDLAERMANKSLRDRESYRSDPSLCLFCREQLPYEKSLINFAIINVLPHLIIKIELDQNSVKIKLDKVY